MIIKKLKGGEEEEFDFNNPESGMVCCEDRDAVTSIASVLEHFGIQVTSYEGTSDWILKLEKVEPVNNGNSATDEELKAFASFIADGCDLASLLEAYEEEIFNDLQAMSDDQLEEQRQFYGYKE